MTTILYTPGTLTVDSRRTSRALDLTEQTVKIRRFYAGTGIDDSTFMRFGDDLVTIGAGAGSSASIEFIFKHLQATGISSIDTLNTCFELLTGVTEPMGSATVILVGQKHLYELYLSTTGKGEKARPRIQLYTRSLDETYSAGTGGCTAETLHGLFGIPPELAVAACSLYDSASGDDVVHCELNEHGHWMHSRVKHYDHFDLLAKLSEYFKGWSLKKSPFTIKKLPKMASNVLVLKPNRAHQDRSHARVLASNAELKKATTKSAKPKPVVKKTFAKKQVSVKKPR